MSAEQESDICRFLEASKDFSRNEMKQIDNQLADVQSMIYILEDGGNILNNDYNSDLEKEANELKLSIPELVQLPKKAIIAEKSQYEEQAEEELDYSVKIVPHYSYDNPITTNVKTNSNITVKSGLRFESVVATNDLALSVIKVDESLISKSGNSNFTIFATPQCRKSIREEGYNGIGIKMLD